jgi:hypothetical protein
MCFIFTHSLKQIEQIFDSQTEMLQMFSWVSEVKEQHRKKMNDILFQKFCKN